MITGSVYPVGDLATGDTFRVTRHPELLMATDFRAANGDRCVVVLQHNGGAPRGTTLYLPRDEPAVLVERGDAAEYAEEGGTFEHDPAANPFQ